MTRILHRIGRAYGSAPRSQAGSYDSRSAIFETLVIASYISLLYKIDTAGLLLLIATAAAFFLLDGKPWRPRWPGAALTAAYIAMATITAFLVDFQGGLQRTVQGLIVVAASAAVVRYVLRLSAPNAIAFFKMFTAINVVILLHCIVFHLMHGHLMTWKYLADTKFIFSTIIVALFFWEDDIRARSLILWGALLAAVFLIVLLSGERKAYLLFIVIYPLSRVRWPMIVGSVAAILLAGALFVTAAPQSYITRQVESGFADADVDALPTRYFFTVSAIADHSDLVRAFVNRNADTLFRQHPWLGVGSTGYVTWARKTYGPLQISRGLSMNVHGERHRVPAEGGIVGIAVALSFLLIAALQISRFWILRGGWAAASMARGPVYLFALMCLYIYSEALDTTMLMLILLVGFMAASLDGPQVAGALRHRRMGLLRRSGAGANVPGGSALRAGSTNNRSNIGLTCG